MPSVKFYLNQPDKKKTVTIIAKINVNGKRFAVATGERIEQKYWNPATQRDRSSYRGCIEINQALDDFTYAFRRVWWTKQTATAKEIRQKFLAQVSDEKKTLVPNLDQSIAQCKEEKDETTARKCAALKGGLYEFTP